MKSWILIGKVVLNIALIVLFVVGVNWMLGHLPGESHPADFIDYSPKSKGH